jgi:pyruvate dehydrogenase E1 component
MQRAMDATVDGEYQNFKAKGGKYVRDNFFAKDPELLRMVEHLSDDDIYRLNRGGHDPYKVYAAYHAATNHTGQPTVILAKTVKGYGMGDAGESENTTHQVKKLDLDELKYFRDRFDVPLSDDQLQDVPYYRPAADSSEMQYLRQSRERLGGFMPRRLVDQETLTVPPLSAFKAQIGGTGEREVSSTMAFVRILATLLRDKHLGKRVVPIVPDEARTFGMEGMFRQLGIYSSEGQLYEPEDSDELAAYKESKSGQVLEEGINEAGAFAAWMAAATSYSTHQYTLLPFYIYYSMFGFQRIGDLAWAAGDLQAKGFLLGGTAGRTTLNGEGLQHQDGHSHVLAATVPNCISYDPAYAFELAVIIRRGLEHMYVEQAPVYYYLTLMNEAYQHPAMPEGVEADIVKGMYLLETLGEASAPKIRLLGSGALLPEARSAAQQLVDDFGLQVQVYSVTSYTELARNVQDHQRDVLLDGENVSVSCHVSDLLNNNDWSEAPVVAVSDYVKSLPEQVRSAIDSPFRVLGTDGFGRSDTREQLRAFFEVDRRFIQYSALSELVAAGHMQLDLRHVREQLGIDTHKPNPRQH